MHAAALTLLRTARGTTTRRACRIVSGTRHPLPRRPFHRSALLLRKSEEDSTTPEHHGVPESNQEENSESEFLTEDGEVVGGSQDGEVVGAGRTRRLVSGRARPNKSRQTEGLPPVLIPDWFLRDNIRRAGQSDAGDSLAIFGEQAGLESSSAVGNVTDDATGESEAAHTDVVPTSNAKYSIHADVYGEIVATLKAGLALRPPKILAKSVLRPHTHLQCPKDGGTFYLDAVVEKVAAKLGADLVRIDAQDIAQIVGPYVDENLAWTGSKTSLLGYETQKIAGKLEEYEKDNSPMDDVEALEDADERGPLADLTKKLASLRDTMGSKRQPAFKKPSNQLFPGIPIIDIFAARAPSQSSQPQKSKDDQWQDLKVSTAMEALVAAAADSGPAAENAGTENFPDVIVQLKDYRELLSTSDGELILRALESAVNRRWHSGRNIILVGTTSSEDTPLSRPQIQHLQSDISDGEKRTIFVPPSRSEETDTAFDADEKLRIRRMNIRHVEDMVTNLAKGNGGPVPLVNIEEGLDNATAYSAGLDDAVWTFARVHRTAVTILGLDETPSKIDGMVFTKAWTLLHNSDEAKFLWGEEEAKLEDVDVDDAIQMITEASSSKSITKDKIKQIKRTCSNHEKRLLGGVIVPSDIRTTFSDVHAPKSVIEALKTLTSLSLIRPEAFSYGVLATDKIPGLLLYGPPGTGKTLLAKAVAKESGATVLEVSGADVNDMYVGEGEKNVKAIFSLAKKLSPCVVFIDEADAIFAARGEAKRTGTHRELINQFLREWDGMNDLSAFIMVATNRPFDLDEAVLRRLPRRLLVDLPVEKDRESILQIHLKDEQLDPAVSLSSLAHTTPFYSGSDLKNLAVAAALACIREENATAAAAASTSPSPSSSSSSSSEQQPPQQTTYTYPARRTLTPSHFETAMQEISASISEDMSTLAAIRKFDEKYGDRKGRRKKGSGLGFGGTREVERTEEGGRVRRVEG